MGQLVIPARDLAKCRRKAEREALEKLLSFQIRCAGLPDPVLHFHPWPGTRKHFDRAWPAAKILLEVQGGTYVNGAHVRPRRYEQDREKINQAALEGWHVFEATTDMVKDGRALGLVRRALERFSPQPQKDVSNAKRTTD